MAKGKRTKDKGKGKVALTAPIAAECQVWERLPDEGPQAFTRFLAYRDMDATVRSQRKVATVFGISEQLVQRWSKRYCWVRRAIAYDNWMLELGDALGKHAVMGHKRRLLRFAEASLDKAQQSVQGINAKRLAANEIVQLAKVGLELGDRALGLEAKSSSAPASVIVQTGVQFASGSEPKWTQSQVEVKQNKVLVNVEPKVLAEPSERDAEAVGPINTTLPTSQLPIPKRLLERVVEAPKAPAQ